MLIPDKLEKVPALLMDCAKRPAKCGSDPAHLVFRPQPFSFCKGPKRDSSKVDHPGIRRKPTAQLPQRFLPHQSQAYMDGAWRVLGSAAHGTCGRLATHVIHFTIIAAFWVLATYIRAAERLKTLVAPGQKSI